ncbi:hypothetical protein LENED_005864 [Lentinula edodes]|uniref:Uncharacterized protein n=1 Tax=Lentinula edodes TaxID=5353 RepID=A0A1Q3EA52_LENED|nr:hypothetical protein LENED_005864 [Lentinula edodes]
MSKGRYVNDAVNWACRLCTSFRFHQRLRTSVDISPFSQLIPLAVFATCSRTSLTLSKRFADCAPREYRLKQGIM